VTGEVPPGALPALPLFPLPRIALFPGCILPLHVFEPRYRAMLADVLASHGCIAMVRIVEDGDDPPTLEHVAGLGVVVKHEELADGRSNILLQGRARVALAELPFEAPYRRARASVLREKDTVVTDVERAALHAAARGFVARVKGHDAEVDLRLPVDLEPGGMADLCAHHLLLDPDARQRALEELDVAARVRAVTGELVAQSAGMPARDRGAAN
jgi:ATP-dependent Lon protease